MEEAQTNSPRILIVGDHKSTHIQNWVKQLVSAGLAVTTVKPSNTAARHGFFSQLVATRKAISNFQPTIVHYHYASRYGLISLLTPFRPKVISVWGSDITVFPKKSIIHAALIRLVLNRANKVLATSQFLKKEATHFCHKSITVTPFGIDTERFTTTNKSENLTRIRFGCIKSYREIYGIQDLIKAFSFVRKQVTDINLILVLAGGGKEQYQVERMLKHFDIDLTAVELHSEIPHEQVHTLHQSLDIAVYPSINEGYGVAALESSACGIPVVASNVGGHQEVVIDGKTGLHVPPASPTLLAEALLKLIANPVLRKQLGDQGRRFVIDNYGLSMSTAAMIDVYGQLVSGIDTSIAE